MAFGAHVGGRAVVSFFCSAVEDSTQPNGTLLQLITPLCSHKHHFPAFNNANRRESEFTKRLSKAKDRELTALKIPQPLKGAPPASKLKRRGEGEFRSPSAVLKKQVATPRRAVTPVVPNKLLEEPSDDDTVIEAEDVPQGATIAGLEQAVLDPELLDSILTNTTEYSARCSDIDAFALFQDEMVQTRAEKNGGKPQEEMVTITKAKFDRCKEKIKTLTAERKAATKLAENNGFSLQAANGEIDKLKEMIIKLDDVPQDAKKELLKLAEATGKLRASVKQYMELNASFKDGEKSLIQERDELIEKCKDFKSNNDKLRAKLAELKKKSPPAVNQKVDEKLAKELEDAQKRIKYLEGLTGRLQATIEQCQDVMGKHKLALPVEMSTIGQKKVREYCRDVCILDSPFVTTMEEKGALIQRIYDGIKDDPELGYTKDDPDTQMDYSEFQRIYGKNCVDQLNQQRQNLVTKLWHAAHGKFCWFLLVRSLP